MVKSDVVAPVLKCTWVISHAHVLSMDERSTFIDFRAFQGSLLTIVLAVLSFSTGLQLALTEVVAPDRLDQIQNRELK